MVNKGEIRQWRGSLEKITLEEFAARLGKEVEESKPTNDVVDIVMSKGTSSNTSSNINDGFSKIAERAFERELRFSQIPNLRSKENVKFLIHHFQSAEKKINRMLFLQKNNL